MRKLDEAKTIKDTLANFVAWLQVSGQWSLIPQITTDPKTHGMEGVDYNPVLEKLLEDFLVDQGHKTRAERSVPVCGHCGDHKHLTEDDFSTETRVLQKRGIQGEDVEVMSECAGPAWRCACGAYTAREVA